MIRTTNFDVSESSISTEVVVKVTNKHDELVRKLKEVQEMKSSKSSRSIEEDFGTCSLHHQKMNSFCIQDVAVVCHKCLLYGDHKFHESLDLECEEDR